MLSEILKTNVLAIFAHPLLQIIILTFLPFLELRASIPHGILIAKQPWLLVFFTAVITNIILGLLLYLVLDKLIELLCKIPFIKKLYTAYIIKLQKRIHTTVEKYGEWGLAIFIGIPLPGSGVYSGALGAKILGFTWKDYTIGCILGVFIAGIAVTIITLGGSAIFS